jgi:hypothetical protein
MSQAGRFVTAASLGAVTTLTGNSGGAVPPTGGNINVVGGNNINIVGNPGTSTLTASVSGTTNHALQLGNASGSLTSLGVATNGQLPIGSTGADPVLNTITAGVGISVTNGAGSITVAATGAGAFAWNDVPGNSQTMVPNNGYVADNAGLCTMTLPAVAAFGTTLFVVGNGAGGWLIAQHAGQNIRLGSAGSTTVGVGGSLASTNQYDSIQLLCVVANTTWNAISIDGNITIV